METWKFGLVLWLIMMGTKYCDRSWTTVLTVAACTETTEYRFSIRDIIRCRVITQHRLPSTSAISTFPVSPPGLDIAEKSIFFFIHEPEAQKNEENSLSVSEFFGALYFGFGFADPTKTSLTLDTTPAHETADPTCREITNIEGNFKNQRFFSRNCRIFLPRDELSLLGEKKKKKNKTKDRSNI